MKNLIESFICSGLAIHVTTKEEATKLLEDLDQLGYKWCSGTSLLDHDMFEDHKERTCYAIEENKKISYCYYNYFVHSSAWELIEYSELCQMISIPTEQLPVKYRKTR